MDSYYFVIGVTLVGFFALAAALLVPVYLFLKKEERLAENWTEESLSAARQEKPELSPDESTARGSSTAG